jgi:hypothetical protein
MKGTLKCQEIFIIKSHQILIQSWMLSLSVRYKMTVTAGTVRCIFTKSLQAFHTSVNIYQGCESIIIMNGAGSGWVDLAFDKNY